MRQLFADIGCGLQLARPLGNGDAPGANAHGGCNVLAAGKARRGHAARPLEEVVFGSAGDDATLVQHQQVTAKAEGLFHIVCDKHHRAAKVGQSGAQLLFGLAAQMRIERGKRLVEQQRIGLHGQAACKRHALPLTA